MQDKLVVFMRACWRRFYNQIKYAEIKIEKYCVVTEDIKVNGVQWTNGVENNRDQHWQSKLTKTIANIECFVELSNSIFAANKRK